jgi:hypothetical protein
MIKEGKKYFIRTVTFHWVGQVEAIENGWVQLSNASWVADSGRFHEAIAEGTLSEVEKVGDAFVNLATATDIIPWKHALPTRSI